MLCFGKTEIKTKIKGVNRQFIVIYEKNMPIYHISMPNDIDE